jgi:hypothetical protein
MASYLNKEISEWNTNDLSSWLLANKYRGISELFQKNSLSGYDLFYIDDDILKNELNLKSFHERKIAMKLITKLTYEHLKLNVINSNGDNVILTLDNNPNTELKEISDYIGNMFNINPKDILFKDSTKQEVLSPTVKIVNMLILYPKIYKTLNVSNMKDYHQVEEELMESGSKDFRDNSEQIFNKNYKDKGDDMGMGSMGSGLGISDENNINYRDMEMNKKYNNYKLKDNNNNNYRHNKNLENEEMNNRRDNNENKNYKYNNKYMKLNEYNNKANINRNQNDNDNFLLNSGSGENNFPEQINDDNMKDQNKKYNAYNSKQNYRMENQNEEYPDNKINNNLGRQFKNEERKYKEREQSERQKRNYQYQGGQNEMMGFNEESNLGLLSSGLDEEMKFKPSYQINNDMDNNNS